MSFQSISGFMRYSLKHLMGLGKRYGWLSFFLWLIAIAPSEALELRVAINKSGSQVKVGSSTTAIVKDGAGRNLGEIAPMNAFLARPSGSNINLERWNATEIWIEPSNNGYVWIGDRWYRGRTRLVRNNQGLMAVNYVDIEDYLYSVVGAEAIPSWPIEALKAQAVAARTYALYKRSQASNTVYDVDTTTGTQVYKGLHSEYTSTHEAVNTTKGEVMVYNGKPILAAFHSSSGGHTENVEDVWMQPLPYLRGVVDYDQQAPVYQWSKTLSSSQMRNLIGGVGNVTSLVPQKKTPRGRVVSMRVVGDRGSKVLTGDKLRQALELRSTLFDVSAGNGQFQIYGRGFGHGIGLSQWGANFLAQGGSNYQQILGHYYQNSQLSRLQ
jgi:stage II sporulation protein D